MKSNFWWESLVLFLGVEIAAYQREIFDFDVQQGISNLVL